MLGLFLYSCWRRHKGLKEGVYHVSAHHGEWEDIRENVLNYDEEGGGEQDQVNVTRLRTFGQAGGGQRMCTTAQTWHLLVVPFPSSRCVSDYFETFRRDRVIQMRPATKPTNISMNICWRMCLSGP